MGTRRTTRTLNPTVLPWIGLGRPRSARPARWTSLFGARAGRWRAGRDQKSPLRRCFKPRPPLSAGCAGFASGCRSGVSELQATADLTSWRSHSGRLSGLLSGCPPTDTRPQARAKLGKAINNRASRESQEKFRARARFSRATRRIRSRSVNERVNEASARRAAVARRSSATGGGERLDAHAVAHEARPSPRGRATKNRICRRVDAVVAETEQIGERPAAGEGGAEHLGADQDRGADARWRRSARGCGGRAGMLRSATCVQVRVPGRVRPVGRQSLRKRPLGSSPAAVGTGRPLPAARRASMCRTVPPRSACRQPSARPVSEPAAIDRAATPPIRAEPALARLERRRSPSPPFADIEPEHFRAAFDAALAEHEARSRRSPPIRRAPTFDNTIAALERSGRLLARVVVRLPCAGRRAHQRRICWRSSARSRRGSPPTGARST